MVWTPQEIERLGGPHFPGANASRHDCIIVDEKTGKERKVKGYEGRMKGSQQILWERGLWKDNMRAAPPSGPAGKTFPKERSAQHVLQACPDFASEMTAFQYLVKQHGHIPEMSPKCHPELAGVGIEYSWGKAKQWMRRKSDHVGAHLHANIEKSLSIGEGCITHPENLPLARVRKYARKARCYRRTYAGDTTSTLGREDIEKHVKTQKVHRGADRQDYGWLMKN